MAGAYSLSGITVIVFCLGFFSAVGLFWEEKHYQLYDTATVTVTQTAPVRHRGRRSSDVMPATIDVNLNLRGSDVRVRLRRNVLARWNVPVFTLTGGHFVQQNTASFMDVGRSGFYQDWQSGASFYVRRPHTHLKAFDLEGPLMINGSAFLLTPSRDLVAMHSGARAHQLKRLLTVIHFGHDFRDERSTTEKGQRARQAQIRRARRQELTRPRRQTRQHTGQLKLTKGSQRTNGQESKRQELIPITHGTTRHPLATSRRHSRADEVARFTGAGQQHDLSGITVHRSNSTPSEGFRSGRQTRSRDTRLGHVTHTVELTIVADYKIFERFLKYAKGDRERALSEMKLYYIFMTNLMDIRYASVTTLDPSLNIRIALVSLVVTDVRAEAVWTEGNRLGEDSVNAERALYTFRDWLRANSNIPRADHWMLFSGYDLAESSGTAATIGIAFIGTLCTDSAVSVVEEYFTATTGAVSAHELGHSLDADHDAMYEHCSDEDSHVMSTIATFPREESRASNPWQFSPCSVDAFGAYLDTVQCAIHPPPKSISTQEVGGLYLDADEQCELAMGPGSYFCRTVQGRLGHDLMCRRMYCYLPDDPGFCASIVPQEYTVCDSTKWCERGKCVFHRDAPSTVPSCPQGDDKGYDCPNADCSQTKVKDAYCCRTCAQRRGVTVSADVTSRTTMPPVSDLVLNEAQPNPASTTPIPPRFTITTMSLRPSVTTSMAKPTERNSDVVTVEVTTSACEDLACECQRRWSIVCLYLYT